MQSSVDTVRQGPEPGMNQSSVSGDGHPSANPMAMHQGTFPLQSGQPATAAVGLDPPASDAEKTNLDLGKSTVGPTISYQPRPANIADHYSDLLEPLSARSRLGMIAQLSVGFYEGWRPSRAEVADLIALKLGVLTVEEAHERVRQRRRGTFVADITPLIISYTASRASRTSTREPTTRSGERHPDGTPAPQGITRTVTMQ